MCKLSCCDVKVFLTFNSFDGVYLGEGRFAKFTYITGGPLPSSCTHAFEGIPFVVACSAVVTRRLVTLTLPWVNSRLVLAIAS